MAAESDNIREGVPITENDIKSYWKRIGKPANSFPRIYMKHNVSLVHMANVVRAITVEVAGLPPEVAPSCWQKLQEKLEYNDKQMVEVLSIQRDERIGFQDFVKECAAGTNPSGRAELHKGKRKASELDEGHKDVVPGAPTVVQKKRSKMTKRRKEDTGPSGAVDGKKVCASPTSPPAKRQSLSPTPRQPTPQPVHAAQRSPRASLFPDMQRGAANASAQGPSTSIRTDSAEGPEPLSESAGPETRAEMRVSPEKARETNGSPVKEGGGKPSQAANVSQTAERRMSPRRSTRPDATPSSPPPTRTGAPPGNSPGPGAERWTSSRRTSRHAEETANPSKSPGVPPTRASKKVAPKERPCPSNAVPPCPNLVPSAANKCKTCGFDVKSFRQRAQEEKREKKVSALKDTKAIIRRVKDDLMILSQKGVQTSLVWYDDSTDGSASAGKVGKKGGSKSKEAHFLGFGELGNSWVDSDDVQKSYKRALRVYKKAKKDFHAEEVKEMSSKGEQPNRAATPVDGPPSVTASVPGSSLYSLPQSLRSIVASLNLEETLRTKVLACLESGEVDEASLKVLIDDSEWLNPMFGDKAGPRTLFKIAVKKWANTGV